MSENFESNIPIYFNYELINGELGVLKIKYKEIANLIADLIKKDVGVEIGSEITTSNFNNSPELTALTFNFYNIKNKRYHDLLDLSIHKSKPGELFLQEFVNLTMQDLAFTTKGTQNE